MQDIFFACRAAAVERIVPREVSGEKRKVGTLEVLSQQQSSKPNHPLYLSQRLNQAPATHRKLHVFPRLIAILSSSSNSLFAYTTHPSLVQPHPPPPAPQWTHTPASPMPLLAHPRSVGCPPPRGFPNQAIVRRSALQPRQPRATHRKHPLFPLSASSPSDCSTSEQNTPPFRPPGYDAGLCTKPPCSASHDGGRLGAIPRGQ